MSKTHSKGHAKKGAARLQPSRRAPDGAVYIGLVMIGVFAMGLWYLVASDTWKHGLIGYVIAMAVLVNLYTWQACRGEHLAGWQQSLARLPLRFAGYGTAGGRPLEAAKGSQRAKVMLFVSIAVSAIIIVGLTFVLI